MKNDIDNDEDLNGKDIKESLVTEDIKEQIKKDPYKVHKILAIIFVFLFHLNDQVALIIDMHVEILFLHTRSSQFYNVGLVGLFYVNGRGCAVCTRHKVGIKEIIEYCWNPIVCSHHWCHNFVLLMFFLLVLQCCFYCF